MFRSAAWSALLILWPPLRGQAFTMVTEQFLSNGAPKIAFDEDRDRLVVTSGRGNLWEWDGSAWGVTAATVANGAFGSASCATYDRVRRRMFFVAGSTSFTLWSSDGHACTLVGPAPAANLLIADPERSRLLAGMIGGSQLSEWDGSTWQPVADLGAAWALQALAYDRARRTAVALTTATADPMQQQTWEGNGASWTQLHSVARVPGALAWDPVRQRVLQRGAGTWEWDGAGWTMIAGAVGTPFWALCADERHGLVWSYHTWGADGDALMAWDGTQWSLRALAPHPRRAEGGFTFDTAQGRAVLFGGRDTNEAPRNELFTWDGNAWRLLSASGPAPRKAHAQVFDAARGETLVFGGIGAQLLGDAWAWNGTWRQLPAGPSPRQNASFAWDGVRGRAVLMGGFTTAPAAVMQDHWEWDGTAWTQVAAGSPVGAQPLRIAFDHAVGRTVLVAADRQTWDYAGGQWTQRAPASPTPWIQSFTYPDQSNLYWHAARGHLQTTLNTVNGVAMHEWLPAANLWVNVGPASGGLRAFDVSRAVLLDYTRSYFSQQTATPAAIEDFGAGCDPGTTLSAFGLPRPGNFALRLDLRTERSVQPAMVGLGLAPGSLALGNGCTLLLSQPLGSWSAVTSADGFLSLPFPVPGLPSLRGISVFAQGVILAPAAPGGFRATQGIRATIGD